MQVNSARPAMKPMMNAPQFGKKEAPKKAAPHKAQMHPAPHKDGFMKAAKHK